MTNLEWLNNYLRSSKVGEATKFNLVRFEKTAGGIFGLLANSLNPSIRFATLEPLQLAIPKGVYTVDFTVSNKFTSDFYKQWKGVPILNNVPGRSGIRIHVGNYPKDSKGCILIGSQCVIGMDMISKSKVAYTAFMDYCEMLGYPRLELFII